MLTTKQAKKVLTKKEQRHLTEMGVHSVRMFRITRETQLQRKEQYPDNPEPCWTCRIIAGKLGWEE